MYHYFRKYCLSRELDDTLKSILLNKEYVMYPKRCFVKVAASYYSLFFYLSITVHSLGPCIYICMFRNTEKLSSKHSMLANDVAKLIAYMPSSPLYTPLTI